MSSLELNNHHESPEYVRMSSAAAISLGFRKGKFYRNARTYCINLLQTYQDGCKANCSYCGQARDLIKGNKCERLIRVEWPIFSLEQIISSLKLKQHLLKRVCVAMISHSRAGNDLITIVRRLKKDIQLPISALVTPTNLTPVHLKELYESEIDMINIALDTATKRLFESLRGRKVKSQHSYDRYLTMLKESLDIFGKGKVGVHLIVGLGETEMEMVSTIQQMYDLGIIVHLFSFYPEPGSALEKMNPPPLGQYRRIQLARYLIEKQYTSYNDIQFNDQNQIIDFGLSRSQFEKSISKGIPFETSGCKGCNRPFANCRPSEPIRNFPFRPTQEDLTAIMKQMSDYTASSIATS